MTDPKNRGINSFIKQFIILSCSVAFITVLLGYSASLITDEADRDTSATPSDKGYVIVIDPGHGGEDGGAVAADGTLEKQLNLEYARTLRLMCNALGIETKMTRDSDELLYDRYSDLEDYKGKKKVYDLKNRLRFANEAGEGAIFVGIHMNKFPDSAYSGTHVYYSPNSEKSAMFAEGVQQKIKNTLQPDNNRQVKKAGSSIFLLNRINIPAILIECGFLSNEAETTMLRSSEYKKEFSLTTAVAIGEFVDSNV